MGKKAIKKPIPVALDEDLLEQIREIAQLWGEADSTVMRQAMRLGLPHLRAEIERLKKGTSNPTAYPPHRNAIMLVEDKPLPKKKGPK